MPFDAKIWQEKIKLQLVNWREKLQRAGLQSNYAYLAAATLWPVLAEVSAGNIEALLPFINLVGSAGKSVLVEKIKNWLKKPETEVAGELEKLVPQDAQLRDELDTLFEKFETYALATQQLATAEQKDFLAKISAELKQLGNLPRFETALRSIQIAGNVETSVFVTGDNASISYIVNQYVTRGEPVAPDLQAQITAYLTWMQERCGLIELRGIKREGQQVVQLPLNEVYVPLAATVLQPRGGQKRGSAPEEQQEISIKLDQVLKLGKRLIVTGGPGCGKTTVLMHLAWILTRALGQNQPDLAIRELSIEPPLPLPIFLPLSAFADFLRRPLPANPHDGTLAAFISRYLIEKQSCFELPQDFFVRLLREGKSVILLLDGLDEVPDEDLRARVKGAIEDLVTGRPDMRVVVTCRTAAYKDRTALGKGFQEIRVQDLTFEHVTALVNRAYQHLFKHDAQLRKAKTDELVHGIQQLEAERAERLGEDTARLVTSPLIVRMLIVVHFSERKLPDQRAELLMKATDAMLAPDYAPDETTTSGIGRLVGGIQIHRDLAQFLAFTLHARGKNGREISEDDLKKVLAENPLYQPLILDFIAVTRLRGTLLEERQCQYRFIHLSFQEYLTGRYLAEIKRNETGVEGIAAFLEQGAVLDSWWREPILLAAGYLSVNNPETARAFIQSLAGISPAAQARRNHLSADVQLAATELAAAAGLEWQPIIPDSKTGLSEHFSRLFQNTDLMTQSRPVLRAQAGNTLARLGDRRPEVMTLEGMEFCLVPGGPFRMGAAENDDLANNGEKPLHLNKLLTRDFWIARYPVTQAQFRRFVAAGGYRQAAWWDEARAAGYWQKNGFKAEFDDQRRQEPVNFSTSFNLPNHPVVGVSWYEALAFCCWLTQWFREKGIVVGEFRLPSEAEWEKAARGGEQIYLPPVRRKLTEIQTVAAERRIENTEMQRRYPWGEDIDPNRANYDQTGIGATSTVGCFPAGASPCGCEEMSGNVREWTRNLWGKDLEKTEFRYPYESVYERERLGAAPEVLRVVRGGSYYHDPQFVRCACRDGDDPYNRDHDVGFRVVFLPYR